MPRFVTSALTRPGPTAVGALTGLLAGLVVLGPALAPGFLLVYDMVFVPEPNFGARALGLDGSVPRAVPNDLVVSLLSLLAPGWVVQKFLLLLVFVLVGGGVGSMVRTRPGAVVAAVAACWNPYVAERLAIGHWAFLLGYALVPWIAVSAAAVLDGDRAGRRRLALWLALAALCGSTAAVIAALTAVAVLALPISGRRVVPAARLWGLAVVGVVTALANAAWWVPAMLIPGQLPADAAGVSAFAARADSPVGLVGSLVTGGGIWHEGLWPAERGSLVLTSAALVLVVGCVSWVVVRRRHAHPAVPGLLLAGLVGLVIAAAGGTVLSEVAVAIVTGVPGGGLIRDGHKFVAPWMVLVACAAGSLGDDVWRGAGGPRNRFTLARSTRATVLVGLGVFPVLLLPSLAFGSARDWNAAHYPESYVAAAAHVDTYDGQAWPRSPGPSTGGTSGTGTPWSSTRGRAWSSRPSWSTTTSRSPTRRSRGRTRAPTWSRSLSRRASLRGFALLFGRSESVSSSCTATNPPRPRRLRSSSASGWSWRTAGSSSTTWDQSRRPATRCLAGAGSDWLSQRSRCSSSWRRVR